MPCPLGKILVKCFGVAREGMVTLGIDWHIRGYSRRYPHAPHGRHWKSCSICSMSLTGISRIFPKFCEFWPEFQGNRSKSCKILEFPKILNQQGLESRINCCCPFLEILKFLATWLSVVHRGGDIFWNSPIIITKATIALCDLLAAVLFKLAHLCLNAFSLVQWSIVNSKNRPDKSQRLKSAWVLLMHVYPGQLELMNLFVLFVKKLKTT